MPPIPAKFDGPVRAVFKEVTGKDLSPQTQHRLARSGKLPMWFVTGTWQTTREHVREFIQKQTEKRLPKSTGDGAEAPAERSEATTRRLRQSGLLPAGAGV